MKESCQYFIGTKDFSACCASNTHVEDKVRTVNSLSIDTNELGDIIIHINGNGFLYNMVRIIVGNLIYIGMGKLAPEDITPILNSRDRRKSAITSPPNGLYLEKIFY